MHLAKREEAGFVSGQLELGADGKALKFFESQPFNFTIDVDTLISAVHADSTTTTTTTSESENK